MCSKRRASAVADLLCVRSFPGCCGNTNAFRLNRGFGILAGLVTAAMLAACAQAPVTSNNYTSFQTDPQTSDRFNPSPQTSARLTRSAVVRPTARHVAVVRKHHVASRHVGHKGHLRLIGRTGSRDVASFYDHDTQTASGEKFDPQQLTAAHRTLPFGTRVRVTNLANGRSVTVRINDRGPFIRGRTVDVSSSAAAALQMTEQGVVNVKLDAVQ